LGGKENMRRDSEKGGRLMVYLKGFRSLKKGTSVR